MFSGVENVVGVDLGDRHIRLAQVARRGEQGLRIRHAACEAYDPLASGEEIASQLRHMWRRAGFSSYTTVSCLRSRSVYYKYCRFPPMSPQELRAAVLMEAEQSLHMPQAAIAADWHRIRTPDDASPDLEGVLVAASKEEIDRHLAILEAAHLYPIAVDVSCLSVCNLAFALKRSEFVGQVTCVVNVSEASADMAILYRDGAIYPRTIHFRTADAGAMAKYLAENLLDVLKYYQFKLYHAAVGKVILTGVVQPNDAVHQRLQTATGLPVELWDPLRDANLTGGERLLHSGKMQGGVQGMTVSLGLALRGIDHG